MIQVSRRSENGSIMRFRVHDLIRDLAMHEAAKENFMTVLPKPKGCNEYPDIATGGIGTRRVSVQSNYCSELIMQIGPHTRSLLLFHKGLKKRESKGLFDKCRLLRVVRVEGEIVLEGVDRLIHLKYLKACLRARGKIPNGFSLHCLEKLETFVVFGTCTFVRQNSFPGLWTIGTLRHVHLLCNDINVSPSFADLKNLQSLQNVFVKEEDELIPNRNCSNLRTLGLDVKSDKCWDRVVHLLGTLPLLLKLQIIASIDVKLPAEIVYPKALPNYENLQSLCLGGKVPALKAALLPPRLLSLHLFDSELENDPMPELGMLKSLKTLELYDCTVCSGEELICPSGFPLLQTLQLCVRNIKSVTVMEGLCPILRTSTVLVAYICNCPPL